MYGAKIKVKLLCRWAIFAATAFFFSLLSPIRGGVCQRHGAKRKLCSKVGCTNQSVEGGVCIRHGAKKKQCRSEGCANLSKKRGVCIRHGATKRRKTICSSERCKLHGKQRWACYRHGATANGAIQKDAQISPRKGECGYAWDEAKTTMQHRRMHKFCPTVEYVRGMGQKRTSKSILDWRILIST